MIPGSLGIVRLWWTDTDRILTAAGIGGTAEEKEQLRHQPQPAKGSESLPEPAKTSQSQPKKTLAQGSHRCHSTGLFTLGIIQKRRKCIPS